MRVNQCARSYSGMTSMGQPMRLFRLLRIVLAEDFRMFQYLAVRWAEQQGQNVTVASTGQEVLTALENEPFDLLLTQMEMSDMDAISLVQAIRGKPRGATNRTIPVFVMTNDAESRERSCKAGIECCVSRPIRSEELRHAINTARWSEDMVDWGRLNAFFGQNFNLNQTLARSFLRELPRVMTELRTAIVLGDAPFVRKLAHTLRSALNPYSDRLSKSALELEQMGRASDLSRAGEAFNVLDRDVELLMMELASSPYLCLETKPPSPVWRAIDELAPGWASFIVESSEQPANPVFDQVSALARLGSNQVVFHFLVEVFLGRCKTFLLLKEELTICQTHGLMPPLEQFGRFVTGFAALAGFLGANRIREEASRLDSIIRRGNVQAVHDQCHLLEIAIEEITPVLSAIVHDAQ